MAWCWIQQLSEKLFKPKTKPKLLFVIFMTPQWAPSLSEKRNIKSHLQDYLYISKWVLSFLLTPYKYFLSDLRCKNALHTCNTRFKINLSPPHGQPQPYLHKPSIPIDSANTETGDVSIGLRGWRTRRVGKQNFTEKNPHHEARHGNQNPRKGARAVRRGGRPGRGHADGKVIMNSSLLLTF